METAVIGVLPRYCGDFFCPSGGFTGPGFPRSSPPASGFSEPAFEYEG